MVKMNWMNPRLECFLCVLESSKMDLGTKMGRGRSKIKSSHNGFKTNVYIGLIDTNPTQLERAQTDILCERYHVLFVSSNKQNKLLNV
jgi:hypothetical protein